MLRKEHHDCGEQADQNEGWSSMMKRKTGEPTNPEMLMVVHDQPELLAGFRSEESEMPVAARYATDATTGVFTVIR
jgi:hypothetical protein